jgi:hypothetical protein
MIASAAAEAGLRDKLRKIEALFAGAATAGEKAAADAAAIRIRARLGQAAEREAAVESNFRFRIIGRVSFSSRCVAGTESARFAIAGCTGKP